MITITINNNQCQIFCKPQLKDKLIKEFKIRAPGYFWSPAYRQRKWDGFVNYVTQAGYFQTGLLPQVVRKFEEWGKEVELEDNREHLEPTKIPKIIGGLELRGYQRDAVENLKNSSIKDIPFSRGLLDQATNAGKNLVLAGIYETYKKPPTIFIVNRQHIFKQAIEEIGGYFPGEVGYLGGKDEKWGNLMICMIQTLEKRANQFAYQINQFRIALVDECHYAATYKFILNRLQNCYIKIGASGTIEKHKDKNKNQKIFSYFGDKIHSITNKELIDQGFSTPVKVIINKGNTTVKINGNYKQEELLGLIKNKERTKQIRKDIKINVKKQRLPILVICKFHNHTEYMYKKVIRDHPDLKVAYIHVGVKDRFNILKQFKEGKIDILVSSLLIKEGLNLPLIRILIYAAGGDSLINILQVIGRLLRKHKSKKSVRFYDYWDTGAYLLRHSKHRIKEYKAQQFPVIEKHKD